MTTRRTNDTPHLRLAAALAFGWAGCLGPDLALAQNPATTPAPANVVALSATGTLDMTMDWLTVTYTTLREGQDAATVQAQLRQALEPALAEARKLSKPGEVVVRTGNFSLHPRYAPKGGVTGWQGQAELVVEGRDTAAIAQLMGRIQTLTIGRVHWSLSREARERVEAEVTAQAISRFRARADAVTKQFGMGSYTVREVSIATNDHGGPQPMMMRANLARGAAAEDAALPVEAGRAQVMATVSGTVQLAR